MTTAEARRTNAIAIDLAIGTIGWAAMTEVDVDAGPVILPVASYGHFNLPDSYNHENRAATCQKRARALGGQILTLVAHYQVSWIFYEYPDKPRSSFSKCVGCGHSPHPGKPRTCRYCGCEHASPHRGGGPLQEFRVMQGLALAEGLLVGLAGELAATHGVQLLAISTTEAKRAILGKDSGLKAAVRAGIERRYGWDLSTLTDDESDAIAVGVAGFLKLRERAVDKAARSSQRRTPANDAPVIRGLDGRPFSRAALARPRR